ncbi:MAG: hypothetical protein ACYTG0_04865 [Planctomycetota bacterium]
MERTEKSGSPPEFFSPQIREARRFYLDLAPPPDTPLAVVCGGYESCAPDYAIHRSSFPSRPLHAGGSSCSHFRRELRPFSSEKIEDR